MPTYAISTPTYGLGGDMYEPPEPHCDSVTLEAKNMREARRLGYQVLKAQRWFTQESPRDMHPYAYLEVVDLKEYMDARGAGD